MIDLVLHPEEFQSIKNVLGRLRQETFAKLVFLIDRNGQLLDAHGAKDELDTTAIGSLTAGNVAATEGLAKLLGESEFSALFHEGLRDQIHISLVAQKLILVVIFGDKSTLGLVRWRVRKATAELEGVAQRIEEKSRTHVGLSTTGEAPFRDLTEDEIDRLFDF